MVSETKIDDSFPETQFINEGYSKPFRRDRNSHGGGLLIYVRDMIPCKAGVDKLLGNYDHIIILLCLRLFRLLYVESPSLIMTIYYY